MNSDVANGKEEVWGGTHAGFFAFWRTNFTIASLCLRWQCELPKKRFVVYYSRNNK